MSRLARFVVDPRCRHVGIFLATAAVTGQSLVNVHLSAMSGREAETIDLIVGFGGAAPTMLTAVVAILRLFFDDPVAPGPKMHGQ
jgi:hypothetical protein